MTEAELISAAQAAWGNTISLISLFITLLSGYLVVAYLAAANMTSSQTGIVNTLYISICSFLLASIFTLSNRATEMAALSVEMSTQRVLEPQLWLSFGVLFVFAICAIASLKFMWDVRHPKTE